MSIFKPQPLFYMEKYNLKYLKVKISAPTQHGKFELPDGSYPVSDVRDYFEYILKNMRQLLIILQ